MSDSPDDSENSTMTSEERKSKYRDLLDKVECIHENEEAGLETTNALDEIIEKANVLFSDSNIKDRIKHTDEVLLDAKVVATASDVLLHITESIDCALDTYEHIELARKINNQLLCDEDSDELDYSKLTVIANKILKQVPNFNSLYGEIGQLNPEEKPKKERQPRKVRKQKPQEQYAAKKAPEKVTEVSKEEDSVDDTVKFIQWALNKECEESGKDKLDYLGFIVDPNDYSKTIENMFHFSFLVRDGRAKINVDRNGVIQVIPVSGHDSKRAKKSGVRYKQSIISIDIDEWQALVKKFGIKKCLLARWRSKWDARKKDNTC